MDFLNSDFAASQAQNSGAFKKLGAATKDLSGSQKRALYGAMGKYKGSSNALEKALGELDVRRDDGISSDQIRKLRALSGAGKIDRSSYYSSRKNNSSGSNGTAQRGSYAPRVAAPIQTSAPSGAQVMQTFKGLRGNGFVKPSY